MFGETALHWASLLGEDRLAATLIPASDLNLKDEKYSSPPLGWAIHGWSDPPAGNHGRQREVIAVLLAAGARVEPGRLESEKVQGGGSHPRVNEGSEAVTPAAKSYQAATSNWRARPWRSLTGLETRETVLLAGKQALPAKPLI
ncbi:MAG TPA: hypothetical protein VG297_05660 [Bryobacteraceae bacterium]|nr:hypothetical protein [Bryobacteraceae bacterium]